METDNYRKGKLSPGNFGYVCRMIDILYKNKCMKTLIKTSFLIGIALLGMTRVQAQTADDIIQKYATAIGGKDAVNSVKSLVVVGNSQVMGTDGPTTITTVVGKGFRSESEFGDMKVINCVTPTAGWGLNPYMGVAVPTAIPADAVKAGQLSLQFNPLVNYAANGYTVELTGKDSADYKLKLSANGQSLNFYINQKTYLMDKMVTTMSAMGQQMEITLSYSDYRKLDGGVMFPFAQSIEYPQATVALTVKTVTVNSTIDPTIFDLPKK
jgi:hypothetical protein